MASIRFVSLTWQEPTHEIGSIRLARWPRFAPRSFGESAAEQTVASETPGRTVGLRGVLATSDSQIVFKALCFGYFHLCQQMKVTASRAHRRASATGGLQLIRTESS